MIFYSQLDMIPNSLKYINILSPTQPQIHAIILWRAITMVIQGAFRINSWYGLNSGFLSAHSKSISGKGRFQLTSPAQISTYYFFYKFKKWSGGLKVLHMFKIQIFQSQGFRSFPGTKNNQHSLSLEVLIKGNTKLSLVEL